MGYHTGPRSGTGASSYGNGATSAHERVNTFVGGMAMMAMELSSLPCRISTPIAIMRVPVDYSLKV